MADIVTLVESGYESINWEKVRASCPKIIAAQPLLHHLTPWQGKILTRFSWMTEPVPTGVGATFTGWPHLRFSEQKKNGMATILRNTFLPPEWEKVGVAAFRIIFI